MALSVATGQPFAGGFDVRRGAVAYVCSEGVVRPACRMMSTASTASSATKTRGINHATAFRPNVLFAPSRRHSRKPECSYELVEAVSYGPRLELYARQKRDGCSVWGDEVESDLSLPGWPPEGGSGSGVKDGGPDGDAPWRGRNDAGEGGPPGRQRGFSLRSALSLSIRSSTSRPVCCPFRRCASSLRFSSARKRLT
jgi:hypothetical protein